MVTDMRLPWFITALATFFVAVLSGLGVGSAGLFVLYLTGICGLAQTEAQGLNLVFFLLSAGASLLFHARRRRIPGGLVLFLLLFAIPGALAGTRLLQALDASTVRRLFGGMLILTGGSALWRELRATRQARQGGNGRKGGQ